MKEGFLDKVKDNVTVRIWSKKTQQEKGDSLTKGYMLELWDSTRISNSAYSCFTFGKEDLVPSLEEYTVLLPRIKQKGDSKCIPWKTLRDLIVAHLDPKKRVDVFALNIYGLVIFPKALGHIDDVVLDPFDRLNKRVMPVPAILAETFRSLNACWRADEERFIGCAQLLLAWFHGHFWKIESVYYRVFFKNYSPLKEFVATPRFYTDVETSIGSLYSGYGELLDMPFYLYSDSIDRGWVKHWSNSDKRLKKKRLKLINGKRNSKMLEFEKML
ncbi:hypothetical protein Gotur_019766 [Gossypium turneri]